jgi:hypothetical protein
MSIQETHDKVANVLGHFVMAFSDLEIAAGAAIMRLLKQEDRVGAVFVAVLSFGKKLELLRALDFKIESNEIRAQFNELLTEIGRINAERNRFLHAEYRTTRAGEDGYGMVISRLRDAHKYERGSRIVHWRMHASVPESCRRSIFTRCDTLMRACP